MKKIIISGYSSVLLFLLMSLSACSLINDNFADFFDETDKCSFSEICSDIVIDSFEIDKYAVLSGNPIAMQFSITNIGNNSHNSDTTLLVYESDNENITKNDKVIAERNIPGISNGGIYSLIVSINASTVIGRKYYGACVSTNESDPIEANDCSFGYLVSIEGNQDSIDAIDIIMQGDTTARPMTLVVMYPAADSYSVGNTIAMTSTIAIAQSAIPVPGIINYYRSELDETDVNLSVDTLIASIPFPSTTATTDSIIYNNTFETTAIEHPHGPGSTFSYFACVSPQIWDSNFDLIEIITINGVSESIMSCDKITATVN